MIRCSVDIRKQEAVLKSNRSRVHKDNRIREPREFRKSSWYQTHIPSALSSQKLLELVREAKDRGCIGKSIIATAMTKCANARWWNALLQVRDMQVSAGVRTTAKMQSIFLAALAACSRPVIGFSVARSRTKQILNLSRQVWSEASPDVVSLTSSFKVCMAIEDRSGLEWAKMLWSWAGQKGHQSNCMACMLYTRVLATYKLWDEVDAMLSHLESLSDIRDMTPLLGSLVDIAGKQHDWQRADKVWHRLAELPKVKPTHIAYTALAKAHFLCGRPHVAARKIDEMLGKGIPINDRLALDHAQQLLVTYHSSLSRSDLERLEAALLRGPPVLKKSDRQVKKHWQQITNISHQLTSSPKPLSLKDVLVYWKATTQSVMKDWENYPAGSNYLTSAPL